MIHPDTHLKIVNKNIGYGVFATRDIPKGTIVYAKDPLDIELSEQEYMALAPPMRAIFEKYSYIEPDGNRVMSWDFARYVNHSCEPNILSTGYNFEIAIRDIHKGEQIVDDYGQLNIEYPFQCDCRTSSCRSRIDKASFDDYIDAWDNSARGALLCMHTVPQPLLPYVDDVTQKAILKFIADGNKYRSVRHLKYDNLPENSRQPRVNCI